MEVKGGSPREVAVPVSVFSSLRSSLEKEAGVLPTVHALHQAGYGAGSAFAETVRATPTNANGQSAFWGRLNAFFEQRGWGTLTHEHAHRGIGILSSDDWAESEDAEEDPDGSCGFSTGFLSGLLSELAGGPIAVLEVSCRCRGQDACRFAFGSEAAIHELYGRLLDGVDLAGALSAL